MIQAMVRYYVELHHALEREVQEAPDNVRELKKAITVLENHLKRVPDGKEKLRAARIAACPEFEVSFLVQGHVTQQVQMLDPTITPERLKELLNKKIVWTTVQENGEVMFVRNSRVIAVVRNVDNCCEFSDFTVEDQMADWTAPDTIFPSRGRRKAE